MEVIALVQGIYYIVTGFWPVFNMSTFERVTGTKADKWLVKMVGLLAAVIGVVILLGDGEEIVKILAILSAAAFALVDIWYSLKGIISKIYLADGLVQSALIVGWIVV